MSSLLRNIFDFPHSSGASQSKSDRPYSFAEQQREEAEDLERSLNDYIGRHLENRHEQEELQYADVPKRRYFYTHRNFPARPEEQQQDTGDERKEACRILDCVRDAFSRASLDDDSETSQLRCPYRPDSEESFEEPCTAYAWSILPLWYKSQAQPLTDYLDDSPYSPLQLENRHPFCEHGAKWRRAFGDLLAMQCGVDAPHDLEDMSKETWMLALPLYLTNQQIQPNRIATRQPENDAEEDGPTELDLYNYFLRTPCLRVTSNTSPSTTDTEGHDTSGQPSVISTMTTTQRTTRPDGSIYTQVVLKKRFSDGREESTETEHTTHGTKRDTGPPKQSSRPLKENSVDSTPALGHDGKVKQAIGQRLEEKKRNGWFWS
ncbi:MAG: hypothetical protein Q9178_004896 [Gyalolechia marmorata]